MNNEIQSKFNVELSKLEEKNQIDKYHYSENALKHNNVKKVKSNMIENIDYNTKAEAFIQFIRSTNINSSEFSFHILKYIQTINERHNEIYTNLKTQIESKEKQISILINEKNSQIQNKKQLENIFFDCIEEAKKYINQIKIKNLNTSSKESKSTVDRVLDHKRNLKIIELLVSQPQVISIIYNNIFDNNDLSSLNEATNNLSIENRPTYKFKENILNVTPAYSNNYYRMNDINPKAQTMSKLFPINKKAFVVKDGKLLIRHKKNQHTSFYKY